MTRFVEPSRAPEGQGWMVRANPPCARITAPTCPFENEAPAVPLRLAAVAGLPGLVVDAPVPLYGVVVLPAAEAVRDRAVLVRTGWDRRRAREDGPDRAPYLAEPTVTALLAGAALVGIDFPSFDGATALQRPVHAS